MSNRVKLSLLLALDVAFSVYVYYNPYVWDHDRPGIVTTILPGLMLFVVAAGLWAVYRESVYGDKNA